jgi:hypothetical protein
VNQPGTKNYSSNMSGILGGASTNFSRDGYPYANGSLPDLKQSKRTSK